MHIDLPVKFGRGFQVAGTLPSERLSGMTTTIICTIYHWLPPGLGLLQTIDLEMRLSP